MAEHKTPKLIARTTLEGYTLANIVTEDGILVATVINDEWTKILVTACNNHDKLVEALRGVNIMLNCQLQRYSEEPWAQRVKEALKEVEGQQGFSPVSMPKKYGKIRDGRIIGGTEDLPNTASKPS